MQDKLPAGKLESDRQIKQAIRLNDDFIDSIQAKLALLERL